MDNDKMNLIGDNDFEDDNDNDEITIVSDKENERIDVYISGYLEEMSRSAVQKLIADGNITVNDKKIKANYKVKIDDSIRIILPEPEILDTAGHSL